MTGASFSSRVPSASPPGMHKTIQKISLKIWPRLKTRDKRLSY